MEIRHPYGPHHDSRRGNRRTGRAAPAPPTRSLDQRLATRGPHLLGCGRREGRPPQPDLLDPLASTSASRSGACGRSSCCSSARSTASTPPRSSCSPPCPPLVGAVLRLPYTFAVGPLRRPQLDDLQRPAAARPEHPRRASCSSPGVSFTTLLIVRRGRRRRRRQLRLVDGQHQRLLPAAAQGLGARHQRRRRQPRRGRGAARRPARAGDRRRRAPAPDRRLSTCR